MMTRSPKAAALDPRLRRYGMHRGSLGVGIFLVEQGWEPRNCRRRPIDPAPG
jgi:hypothetical protein